MSLILTKSYKMTEQVLLFPLYLKRKGFTAVLSDSPKASWGTRLPVGLQCLSPALPHPLCLASTLPTLTGPVTAAFEGGAEISLGGFVLMLPEHTLHSSNKLGATTPAWRGISASLLKEKDLSWNFKLWLGTEDSHDTISPSFTGNLQEVFHNISCLSSTCKALPGQSGRQGYLVISGFQRWAWRQLLQAFKSMCKTMSVYLQFSQDVDYSFPQILRMPPHHGLDPIEGFQSSRN